ncbi:MAG: hypothetical protein M1832_004973 [Thelocarpon impressellum]|nr:MAG: hypothetical protein M1832_004973 [Thelocarpon impressellum]
MSVSPMTMPAQPVQAAYGQDHCAASPVDRVDRQDFAQQRGRKYSSTGGGRAWTEQEEVYLLQTRLQKMPYKHIAAHLKKTELACRLHYHQLSHGTNRRKRAASVSSCSSGPSPMTPDQRLSPDVDLSASLATPDQSPVDGASVRHMWNIREDGSHSCAGSPQTTQKPPLLPKPVSSFPHHARAINKALRLDCRTNLGRAVPVVDRERLRRAYEAHRVSFWKMIAADYGDNVDPHALEEAWQSGGAPALMTPDSSMEEVRRLGPSALPSLAQSDRDRGFSPVNRRTSHSPGPGLGARAALTLPAPTPSIAATAGGPPMRATAIANLLTDDIDTRRSSLKLSPPVADRDALMRDPAN